MVTDRELLREALGWVQQVNPHALDVEAFTAFTAQVRERLATPSPFSTVRQVGWASWDDAWASMGQPRILSAMKTPYLHQCPVWIDIADIAKWLKELPNDQ